MQGIKRKLVYVSLYEGLAIAFASVGLAWLSDGGAARSTALAVMSSAIAMLWNLSFNTVFEAWEARQVERHRSVRRRVVHAIGFEGGLAALLVPVFAWWLNVSLWQALWMDIALLVFFLVYTFVFNWCFDRAFGLPDAVTQGAVKSEAASA
jgi:uncharacterized membrane protein